MCEEEPRPVLQHKTQMLQDAVVSASLLTSPWWLNYVDPLSKEAATLVPILGFILGVLQIARAIRSFGKSG